MQHYNSRSRLMTVRWSLVMVCAFLPSAALALQQRVMVADYGFSDAEAGRLIMTAPPGTLVITGCRINAEANPPFEQAFHDRASRYKQAGFTVIGYITSFDGREGLDTRFNPPMCRDESCVNDQVDQYWSMYSDVVDGIMFDEGAGLSEYPAREVFYKHIYDHAKMRFPSGTIFLNVSIPLQESQQHLIDINRVADIFQPYESPCTQYLTSYEWPHWPTWWWTVPPERKSELPSECTCDQVIAAVAKSKLYGVGTIYVYDGSADDYGHLPPGRPDVCPDFWTMEVAAILDSSTPRSVNELRQYFYGDTVFTYIWSVFQQSASVAGNGTLVLTPDAGVGGAIARVTSQSAWNLTDAAVSVRMDEVVDTTNGYVNNKFGILRGQADFDNSLYWWYEGGQLYFEYSLAGVQTILGSLPYSSSDHRWLRIRESAGNVYWETSATGSADNWVIQGTVPTASLFPVSSVYVTLDAQTFGPGTPTPGRARYSRLNTGP